MKKLLIFGLLAMTMAAAARAEYIVDWIETSYVNDAGITAQPGFCDDDMNQNGMLLGHSPTPVGEVPYGANHAPVSAVDSHFLLPLGEMTVFSEYEPYEVHDLSIDGIVGWGTDLGDTFGVAPSDQVMTLDFAPHYE